MSNRIVNDGHQRPLTMRSYASNPTPCSSGNRYASVAEAAAQQNTAAVSEMLSQGYRADGQDFDGNTALHYTALFSLDSLLDPLLERGARPDVGNSSGECAVHWAVNSSNVSALDKMTNTNRALLSMRDCDGFTAFIVAAQMNNYPVMEWLYLKGISLEEQDDCGRTALQWACYKGNKKTVHWLLSRSASIVHRDREGMTALHWAVLQGHMQVVEMLMEVGAVGLINVPDCTGETPIALAMRKRNRFLVMAFHKCQVFDFLFGKPHVFQNFMPSAFLCFVVYHITIFAPDHRTGNCGQKFRSRHALVHADGAVTAALGAVPLLGSGLAPATHHTLPAPSAGKRLGS